MQAFRQRLQHELATRQTIFGFGDFHLNKQEIAETNQVDRQAARHGQAEACTPGSHAASGQNLALKPARHRRGAAKSIDSQGTARPSSSLARPELKASQRPALSLDLIICNFCVPGKSSQIKPVWHGVTPSGFAPVDLKFR